MKEELGGGSILEVEHEDGQRMAETVDDSNALGSDVKNLAEDALLTTQLQYEDSFRPTRQRKVPDRLIHDPEYQSTYNKYDKRKRRAGADDSDT